MKISLTILIILSAVTIAVSTAHAGDYLDEHDCQDQADPVTFEEKICDNEFLFDTCGVGCSPEQTVEASSQTQGHPPEMANDFSTRTAWIESSEQEKEPCIIVLRIEDDRGFDGIWIFNGYQFSEDEWNNYSRVKVFKVYYNGKFYKEVQLDDTPLYQDFDLDMNSVNKGDVFKLVVTDRYQGKLSRSVAITEIALVGSH